MKGVRVARTTRPHILTSALVIMGVLFLMFSTLSLVRKARLHAEPSDLASGSTTTAASDASTYISNGILYQTHGGEQFLARRLSSSGPPRMIQIAHHPRVFYLTNIMTPEEADAIIEVARPALSRSKTVASEKNPNFVSSERTSNGMFMATARQKAMIAPIAQRISKMVGIPAQNFEAMQVLRYTDGQQYVPHPDYFSGDYLKEQQKRGGQRQATIIMFLNDVTNGGQTEFPQLGVSVPPTKGNAVLFWSKNIDGTVEPKSLHAGRQPQGGTEKWVAVFWMREGLFK